MKNIVCLISLFLCCLPAVNAQSSEKIKALVGTYVIDLRPTPHSEEYLQYFTISRIAKNSFEGSFYGTEIKNGLVNDKFENTFLAFTTEDRSNTYYHYIKIVKAGIEGLTYSSDRALIQPWKGIKKE